VKETHFLNSLGAVLIGVGSIAEDAAQGQGASAATGCFVPEESCGEGPAQVDKIVIHLPADETVLKHA
jgi:hypothetical protein